MKKVILASLLMAFSGCAHGYWRKEGATQQDFYRDSIECRTKLGQSGVHNVPYSFVSNEGQFLQQCMMGNGWNFGE